MDAAPYLWWDFSCVGTPAEMPGSSLRYLTGTPASDRGRSEDREEEHVCVSLGGGGGRAK